MKKCKLCLHDVKKVYALEEISTSFGAERGRLMCGFGLCDANLALGKVDSRNCQLPICTAANQFLTHDVCHIVGKKLVCRWQD